MKKYFLSLLLFVHGLIHLTGFMRAWKYNSSPAPAQFNNSLPIVASFWLLCCIGFLSSSFSFLLKQSWWWMPAMVSILLSQVLIVLNWKEARWGTAINFLVLLCTLVSFGQWQFERTVKREAAALFASSTQK